MRQRAVRSSVVLGSVIGFVMGFMAVGCAGKSFVRADPPIAAQGVSVSLVDEACALDSDPEQGGTFLLDLAITLQVNDDAPSPVSFHPDRARLILAGRETASDDRPEAISVGAGSKKNVRVHFLQKGRDVACNNPMSLALDRAVDLDQKPLPLAPISFQATSSPDS